MVEYDKREPDVCTHAKIKNLEEGIDTLEQGEGGEYGR